MAGHVERPRNVAGRPTERPPPRRVIPNGRQVPRAELVCLAVAQVLLGARSEHHWLRMCYGRLGLI